ncbi:hypothetical protein ACFY3U_22625 [Micromonospora sp. NPDC000089]|uniref:hypothetical protein n=1 Tax=unclassified Micromonospora TaxID=2617518 RepID=UPI003691001B
MVVLGVLLATSGYLMPWFRIAAGYSWSFSGWTYASLDSGGGWTLITLVWLAVTAVAGCWARASSAAALTALTGGIGAMIFALTVVAASFTEFPQRGYSDAIAHLPFGVGLPVMAAGFGLLIAGAVRAVARTA